MQTFLGIVAVIIGAVIAFKVLFILFHVIGFLFKILTLVIWIGALLHILFSQFSSTATKVAWFVAVLIFNVVGAVAYFVFGRPRNAITI